MVSVEDGIACAYGLNKIQVADMIKFDGNVKEIVLDLENENAGIIISY